MIIAKPTADSAAATVNTSNAVYWPYISSKWIEEKIKFKFKANSRTSTPKRITIMFLKLNIIPVNADIKMIRLLIIGLILCV